MLRICRNSNVRVSLPDGNVVILQYMYKTIFTNGINRIISGIRYKNYHNNVLTVKCTTKLSQFHPMLLLVTSCQKSKVNKLLKITYKLRIQIPMDALKTSNLSHNRVGGFVAIHPNYQEGE